MEDSLHKASICRSGSGVDDTEVAATTEALEASQRLSEAAASGSRLGPADQAVAEDILSIPVVAQVNGISSRIPINFLALLVLLLLSMCKSHFILFSDTSASQLLRASA